MPTRGAIDVFPVEARIGHGLVGAEDADAAGAGAAADLLAFLVAKLVEVAHPRQGGAKVAGLVGRHAAAAFQQGLAELGQRIPVRRGKSHAGNHNPLMIRPFHSRQPCRHSMPNNLGYPVAGRLASGRAKPGHISHLWRGLTLL